VAVTGPSCAFAASPVALEVSPESHGGCDSPDAGMVACPHQGEMHPDALVRSVAQPEDAILPVAPIADPTVFGPSVATATDCTYSASVPRAAPLRI
ncbi:MAG: hypothetical protein OEV43_04905, partial [Coriobacteriia bacterium]|nr:hypothetical protein [Coriobacteriia bacterium]